MKPKISIIMGIYNPKNKEMIDKCLDSIMNQTFKEWECILCNDGTTNGLFDYIKKNYGHDTRFVFIENEKNSGLRVALNNAIKFAKADYLVRQDIDDYSAANRLEKMIEYMSLHKDVDVLGTGMYKFDDNNVWGQFVPKVKNANKKSFLSGTIVAHPTVIMRKEAITQVGGYRVAWETTRCEDTDLFMRMYANGSIITNIDDKLYYYREDLDAFKKRKFLNRIKEAVVRYKGYKILREPIWGYIYVFKPIILGLIPSYFLYILKKRK